jgi:hypothetical protein
MANYLELCQKFRKVVGISGSGPATVTGQAGMEEKITIWIADADEVIQREWEDWSFLLQPKVVITATANVDTFTLGDLSITDLAKWRRNKFVRNPGTAQFKKLSYDMNYDEFLESDRYLGVAQTGVIERVIIRTSDNAVIFFPKPAVNTTVWGSYFKAPTRMSLDASVSAIPARFHDIIIYRAKMFYAEHLEDIALYNAARMDYENLLTRLQSSQLESFKDMFSAGTDEYEDVTVV